MAEVVKKTVRRYRVTQVGRNFSTFNERWRDVRDRSRYKANSCFVCGRHFNEGESIAILLFENHQNRVACDDCATALDPQQEGGGDDLGR